MGGFSNWYIGANLIRIKYCSSRWYYFYHQRSDQIIARIMSRTEEEGDGGVGNAEDGYPKDNGAGEEYRAQTGSPA